MRRVGDTYVEATWDEAIADIAARMNAAIDAGGPDAVGAYYGNPAGFSSSNIIFYNGWLDAIGTHSRYSVGSVDQNAMHVVASAMYGSMLMAPVSDIDNCDYFLLVGTNPAVSAWNWLETVPGGWKRALERKRQGAKIVVVDPLRTETVDKADVHLAVRPGQDWALLLAMVKIVLEEGLEHKEDCAELATGIADLRALVADADLDDLAVRCDVPAGRHRTGGKGLRHRVAGDGGHPDRRLYASGGHRRRVAGARAQRHHRPDGPARRSTLRARLRRRRRAGRPGQDHAALQPAARPPDGCGRPRTQRIA